jgi:cytidylate kinase
VNYLNVKKALKLRNISDKKRKHSPLKMHKNAVVVNTGKLNKQAMVEKMSKHVERILKIKYGN